MRDDGKARGRRAALSAALGLRWEAREAREKPEIRGRRSDVRCQKTER